MVLEWCYMNEVIIIIISYTVKQNDLSKHHCTD